MLRFFAGHPTAANLLMLLFLVLGLSRLPDIKRETFPDFASSEIEVSVAWPGAAPEDVEEAVCQRLEDATEGTSALTETRCESREGLARLTAEMSEEGDIGRFINDIKTAVDAIDDFPDEAEQPVVSEKNRFDQVISIAVTADTSQPHLKVYAEDLKRRLKQLPGVALVEIEGFSDHQLRIELSLPLLRQYNLSMADIADQISRQNIRLPAGEIETLNSTLLIRFDNRRSTPQELARLVVASSPEGAVIRLGDIARIEDRFEKDEEKILFDGRIAAIIKISKSKADDALDVKAQVDGFIATEQHRKPAGVSLTLTRDNTTLISDRLNMLLTNGWQGLVLVALTMWLFFSFRYAFWVAMGLPVSFLGTLFVMGLFDISLNMMSMVALLMAIGILMDDAIVIAESIAAHVRRGRSLLEGAVAGVRRVGNGVFSSFLTTVCVFGGLAFLEGDIGKVLKYVPIVLIITLSVSLIEAFLILPGHLVHSLNRSGPDPDGQPSGTGFKYRFQQRFEQFRNQQLVALVEWVVRWRYLFSGLVIGLLMASVALPVSGLLKFAAFPDLDGNQAEARLLLPQGTPLSRTEQLVEQLVSEARRLNEELSEQQPEGRDLVEHITVQYNQNADAFESGPHVATVMLDILSSEVRTTDIDDFIDRWRQRVGNPPGVIAISFKQPVVGPAGRAIEIRLQHPDLKVLSQASWQLQNWLRRYQGVNDLIDDLRPGKEEIRVSLRPGADTYGVDALLIASQLRAAFHGSTADEIQQGTETLELEVMLSELDRSLLPRFANFPIVLPGGEQIPLATVAELETGRGTARINRIDGLRTLTLYGDVDSTLTNTNEILRQTRSDFLPQLLQTYPQLQVSLEGEASSGQETGASVVKGFALGLLAVYIILSFQFRSYLEPFIVMLAIPLSLIGVLWGHLLMGFDLTMPGIIGFVSLAGIVVNNSILLVQFIKWHHQQGYSTHEAAVLASRERFRAIFITTATTIAGLIPLLSEQSLQAQVLIPLVLSIVSGLLITTLLVLLVIPALYCILDDAGLSQLSQQQNHGEDDRKVAAEADRMQAVTDS